MPDVHETFSEDLHPYIHWWREKCGIKQVTDDEIIRARTAYWALVTRMDIMIGQIITALNENDLNDNTIILYSSDHGEQVGEHGLWWKQTFYEHSVKVPAILSWRGNIPEGIQCNRVISSLDLNATMLDAIDAPPLPNSRGRTVLPLLNNPDTEWDDTAFSEFCTDDGCYHRMIRKGEWKLNYYHGQPSQLFNLSDDPNELNDRANDPNSRDILRELTKMVLHDWNPELIAQQMQAKREDTRILGNWARNTNPPDNYRWKLLPEMDYLD